MTRDKNEHSKAYTFASCLAVVYPSSLISDKNIIEKNKNASEK